MTLAATVVRIMIASPSDVSTERGMLRSAMSDWNDLHTARTGIVALPLAWETHSVPLMGAPPQSVINEQLTDLADVVVAVFWTRLGTPTTEAPSGTAEEVRRHVRAGKPTLIYFSKVPVRYDSVEEEQYKALKAFQRECEEQGLIDTYESVAELHDKFLRHLTRLLPEKFGSGAQVVANEASGAPVVSMSDEARALLSATADDPHGHILYLRVIGGPRIQVSGRTLNEAGNRRSQALWESALEELETLGLIKALNAEREVFGLTHVGYGVADQMKQSGATPA
jgi:hypothetical protein